MKLLRSLYALTIFVSAFLLFVVEPMVAKQLLPSLGGSSAVWTTCLVFFSIALLLGYLYAHWLSSRFTSTQQSVIHILLLTAALMTLGVHISPKPSAVSYHPALTVFRVLAAVIGLPYLALSATTPLLTSWYAGTFEGQSPYRLFALSNFASLSGPGQLPAAHRAEPDHEPANLLVECGLSALRCTLRCDRLARPQTAAFPSSCGAGWKNPPCRPGSLLVCPRHGRRHDADCGHSPHERKHRRHPLVVAAAPGPLSAELHPGLSRSLAAPSPAHVAGGVLRCGIDGIHAAGHSCPAGPSC